LDRRREAYLAALEYIYQTDQKDEDALTQMGQQAELQIYAFGSQKVVDAWRRWLDGEWLPDVAPKDQPTWLELSRCMREDLGSNLA
jgi:hypothetical protein